MARPRIPVLVGTVALLAGCGSQTRVEVSGVVRDGETGRVIANALVVGADGSSTRTDTEGRFSLFVRRDERRSIRASAHLHEDRVAYFDPQLHGGDAAMAFALTPLHGPALIEEDDPDAVLRWLREAWLSDPESSGVDGDSPAGITPSRDVLSRDVPSRDVLSRDVPSRDVPSRDVLSRDVPAFGSDHASWSRDAIASRVHDAFERGEDPVTLAHSGAIACGTCHAVEDAMLTSRSLPTASYPTASSPSAAADPPHAALDGGCLACHGERAADGVRMRSGLESDLEPARCTGCHASPRAASAAWRDSADLRALRMPAQQAMARADAAFARAVGHVTRCGHTATGVARIDGALILLDVRGLPLGDCDGSGAIDGSEIAIGLEVLDPRMVAVAQDLVRLHEDRSRGVHQPHLTRALADRIETALH